MAIRPVTEKDIEGIRALWLADPLCVRAMNAVDDSPEGLARYLRRNPDTCFLAEEDGAVCGVILAGHDGRRGMFHHLCVAEAWRRRGIATELVRHAEDALRAQGIRTQLYFEQKKFKAKMSYADKLAIPYAVFLGEDEIAQGKCSVKDLRTGVQETVTPEEAAGKIKAGIEALSQGKVIVE